MISHEGTFEYKAEFKAEGFSASDVVLHGETVHGETIKRLVGHRPLIRFWNDRLILVASDQTNASVRNVSFRIGDSFPLGARPGDQLYVVRTGAGGFGLSLLRQETLILAVGAAAAVHLGPVIKVIRCPNNSGAMAADTWLQFRVAEEQLLARDRSWCELEDYCIYVERGWEDSTPGIDECVAICQARDGDLMFAAVRSAILLATDYFKITHWDCTEYISE